MKDIEDYSKMISSELVIGRYESILLLGAQAQSRLRILSKSMTRAVLNDGSDLEWQLQQTVEKIDRFQKTPFKSSFGFLGKYGTKVENITRKGMELSKEIDEINERLRKDEQNLLKDVILFQEWDNQLSEVSNELKKAILIGEETLETRTANVSGTINDIDDWYIRLKRRLDELNISYTLTMQCKAQLKLMVSNYRNMIEKINGAISVTIPAWRNQVTMLVDIEKNQKLKSNQSKLKESLDSVNRKNESLLLDLNELWQLKINDSKDKESINELLENI